jgi:hypothetical protein
MSEQTDSRLSFKDVVELGSKAIIGVATACFATGLLIVNVWLSRHGVYSSEFVRTEYVLAGAAFISLVIFAGFGLEYFVAGIKYCAWLWKQGHRFKSAWYTVPTIFGLIGVPILLMRILSDGRLDFGRWKIWFVVPILVLAYFSAREIILHVSKFWTQTTTPGGVRDSKKILLRIDDRLFVVFPSLLASMSLYASYVYPEIAPEFGGGHKDSVILVLTSNGREISEHIGLPTQPDKTIGPVILLTESDKELSVARVDEGMTKSPAVRIKRELIDVILTQSVEHAAATQSESKAEMNRSSNTPASPGLARPPGR